MNSCSFCDKTYKFQSGLSRHLKTCDLKPIVISPVIEQQPNLLLELLQEQKRTNLLLEQQNALQLEANNLLKEQLETQMQSNNLLLLQNKLLKEQPIQQQQAIIQQPIIITNKKDISNTLNNTHSNAIDINEFIDNITITENDIEYTLDNTLIKGVANIFNNNIARIPRDKRPIYSNNKQIFIKNNGIFQEDLIGEGIDYITRCISKMQISAGQIKTDIMLLNDRAKEKYMTRMRVLTGETEKYKSQFINLITKSIMI